jgi:hypothetical protein
VGRTRRGLEGVTPAELWAEIGRGTGDFGLDVAPSPLHFGHPDCTRIVPVLAVQRRGAAAPRLLQLIRDEPADRALLEGYFARGLGGAAFREDAPLAKVGRALGIVRRAPRWFGGEVRRWAAARLRTELGMGPAALLLGWLAGRVRLDGLTLTSHHFMDAAEVATPTGQARLAACVFRLAQDGRLAPMCEVNAGDLRARAYAAQRAAAAAS